MIIAPLDRFISVSSGPKEYENAQRLSDLADAPYVVLLGGPGSGKSVAFEQFAGQAGFESISAFRFRQRHLSDSSTVFIDALDEVSLAKAVEIAGWLEDKPTVRWRISCRAQDWNEGGKLSQALSEGLAAHYADPVVAHLQTLTDEEATAVLGAFGCQAPAGLITILHNLRSTPFVRSPLGLKFLMSVKPERLPILSRFTLYESGVRHFAIEHNPFKAEDRQVSKLSPESILDHAGRVFLTLLLAGKHGVKRAGLVGDALVSEHDLGIDLGDLTTVLDTALFSKKGEDFLPFHRSIQEFLGARYLARLVTGALDGKRLHIERATALLVSADGLPPESFKALYAWFTCHLVNEGSPERAQRLLRRDPETLLLHGDAAMLPVASRITILNEVGACDPYFRWTPNQWGPAEICTVGLITPEMVPLVTDFLLKETSTHRLSVLLDALSVGPAQESTAEACWNVVLRQSETQWCREQAVIAWLHNASPSEPEIWGRIDALSIPNGSQRGHLRSIAQLFCAIPAERLSVGDVERVLACLKKANKLLRAGNTQRDGGAVSIYATRDIAWHVAVRLWRHLILDEPKRWRVQAGVGSLEHQFSNVLCIAALSEQEVSAEELAKMMVATGLITGAETTFRNSVQKWMVDQSKAEALLDALISNTDQDIVGIGSLGLGLVLIGLEPSEKLVRMLLSADELVANVGGSYVGQQVTTWVLRRGEPAPPWFGPLLQENQGVATETVLQGIQLHIEEELEREAHDLDSVERWLLCQIPEWRLQLCEVAAGKVESALRWGAEIYCGSQPLPGRHRSGSEALKEAFGEELANSAMAGLVDVWSKNLQGEDSTGASILAASASLYLESGQNFSDEPLGRMLLAMRVTMVMRDNYLKQRLEASCIARLSQIFIDDTTKFAQLSEKWDISWAAFINKLLEYPERSALHLWAVQVALNHLDKLRGRLLDGVLRLAELNFDPQELACMVGEVLRGSNARTAGMIEGGDLSCEDRLRWAYFGVCLQQEEFCNEFKRALDSVGDTVVHRIIIENYPRSGYCRTPTSTLAVSRLLILFLIRRAPLMQGHFDRVWPDAYKVLKAISLSREPGVQAILMELIEDADGTRWVDTLRHELELYKRDLRSQTQRFFSPHELAKVLDGRGPINATDLKALVLLILEEIANELQPSSVNVWKLFWDNNKPKVENDCRDVLAGKIKDKLSLFGNFEVAPEVASSGGTRADLVVSSGAYQVPLEAKRTNHPYLWYGHSGQLQTYTLAKGTEGQGIYVIFWFGNALGVTTAPDGVKPSSPEVLKALLAKQLSSTLAATTSVFVLDVSDAAQVAKVRKVREFDRARGLKR